MSAAEKIERLLGEAERLPDPRARGIAKQLAAAMIELVGGGMEKVLAVADSVQQRALADDPLVGNLLVLCGLHPDPIVVRAERALADATVELSSLGATVASVAAIGEGVAVTLRAERGGVADRDKLRAMVEAIVIARAPDAVAIAVELDGRGLSPSGSAAEGQRGSKDAVPLRDGAFIPVEQLTRTGRAVP